VDLRDALKKDEFEHVIKKLDYDRKVFEIWKTKCAGVGLARMHAKQEHIVNEHRKVVQTVENYVEGCVRFLTWEAHKSADSLIPQLLNFRMEALKKLRNQPQPGSVSDVPSLVLINWTAPCLLPAQRQKDHANVLAWALHDNANSCGIILSPTFSYQKGKTSLEEHAALNVLAQMGFNLDYQFSLLYAERCDLRDARTEPVKQLPAKDLKEVEDMADDSVPTSCSSGFVTGAAKHCQVGAPAAEEILRKLFSGVDLVPTQTPAVLVIDLFPRVGDFSQAFCKLRNSLTSTASLFYVAVAEKGKEVDWLRATLVEDLVDKVKAEQFQVPGQRPFQKEVSADLLEALPALPVMNLLVTTGEGDEKKLKIPSSLVKKWSCDEDFAQVFSKWLDEFCEVYSVADETENTSSPNKRPAEGQDAASQAQPSPKKLKFDEVGAEHLTPNDKISETLLVECKLGGKDSLNFQVRTGNRAYFVNLTGNEISLKPYAALVGFGRGAFKLFKGDDVVPEKAVIFTMGPDSLVSVNGVISSVSEALTKQRQTKPDAVVCYHKANPVPEKPGEFTFTQTHKVGFVPPGKKEGAPEEAVTATNLAARVSMSSFQSLHCVAFVWHSKWTVKGLQPIKPMLHLVKALVLTPGTACKLNA
ncbi:unnamed protein product, partial [Durusdinium trenchii]